MMSSQKKAAASGKGSAGKGDDEKTASSSSSSSASRPRRRTKFFPKGNILRTEPRFDPQEIVGHGAYGIVCSAKDLATNELVCIKKIERVVHSRGVARRTYRELLFLRHFRGHENIMNLIRVMRPSGRDYHNVYVVSELMETDLACVIRSPQQLTDDHIQFFIYQILRGVKYMHSAGVVHRDMKPRNLLVNSNCDLKICDFGLARFEDDHDNVVMSDYVATRWYRSPEIILRRGYSRSVDMWAVGCILGELLCRKPLFPGNNEIHQLHLIRSNLGLDDDAKEEDAPKPDPSARSSRKSQTAVRLQQSIAHVRKQEAHVRLKLEAVNAQSDKHRKLRYQLDALLEERRRLSEELNRTSTCTDPYSPKFATYAAPLKKRILSHCPNCNPDALDLLVNLLAWRVSERFTAEQALSHPYLQELHVPADEPVCDAMDPRLFYFERKHTKKEELAAMIYDEITSQYPEDNKHYDIDPQSVFPHKSKKSRRRKRRKSF